MYLQPGILLEIEVENVYDWEANEEGTLHLRSHFRKLYFLQQARVSVWMNGELLTCGPHLFPFHRLAGHLESVAVSLGGAV